MTEERPHVTIEGTLVPEETTFKMELDSPVKPEHGDDVKPAEVVQTEGSVTLSGTDVDTYLDFIYGKERDLFRVEMEWHGPPLPGRRVLWGKRKRDVQISGYGDRYTVPRKVTMPRVRFGEPS